MFGLNSVILVYIFGLYSVKNKIEFFLTEQKKIKFKYLDILQLIWSILSNYG